MRLDTTEASLAVYEALASKVRLQIIQLLAKEKLSVKELAERLQLSSAIITKHIKKLEAANLVRSERVGKQKISSLRVDQITIDFPEKIANAYSSKVSVVPVGLYMDYAVKPTCGLASSQHFIGQVDEPKFFMDPQRIQAQILWFTEGFVEYQVPNLLTAAETLKMLEISLELSSEFPYANSHWPSDITFSLNGIELGTWTSPGDFADKRGTYTPNWYPAEQNQYGLLKTLRIMSHGTYIENQRLSPIKLQDLPQTPDTWQFKIEVKETAQHVGGCTIFGKGFGDYDQDIEIRSYYL